jgi:hypothetical protein
LKSIYLPDQVALWYQSVVIVPSTFLMTLRSKNGMKLSISVSRFSVIAAKIKILISHLAKLSKFENKNCPSLGYDTLLGVVYQQLNEQFLRRIPKKNKIFTKN